MSDFEMNALDKEVEDVANRGAQNGRIPSGEQKPFWDQLDDEIHYKKYRRNRQIVAVVKIVICILAAAALVCAMYIPQAMPYIVNIGVAAFIVAGAITLDRTVARWRV